MTNETISVVRKTDIEAYPTVKYTKTAQGVLVTSLSKGTTSAIVDFPFEVLQAIVADTEAVAVLTPSKPDPVTVREQEAYPLKVGQVVHGYVHGGCREIGEIIQIDPYCLQQFNFILADIGGITRRIYTHDITKVTCDYIYTDTRWLTNTYRCNGVEYGILEPDFGVKA